MPQSDISVDTSASQVTVQRQNYMKSKNCKNSASGNVNTKQCLSQRFKILNEEEFDFVRELDIMERNRTSIVGWPSS